MKVYNVMIQHVMNCKYNYSQKLKNTVVGYIGCAFGFCQRDIQILLIFELMQ